MILKEGEGETIAVSADVTSFKDCEMIVKRAISEFGRLDILVNNVGVGGQRRAAEDVDEEEWAKVFDSSITFRLKEVLEIIMGEVNFKSQRCSEDFCDMDEKLRCLRLDRLKSINPLPSPSAPRLTCLANPSPAPAAEPHLTCQCIIGVCEDARSGSMNVKAHLGCSAVLRGSLECMFSFHVTRLSPHTFPNRHPGNGQ